ncbi:MAG TPA: phosphoglycerate dehydrogenase [Candidatus Saccharimonadales bacterium]|nr:phosphoglycerate dehydrogenase [Candidatus Saccharimonadales bacterium]
MFWKVLLTARTMDEVGAGAIRLMKDAGCELIIPKRFGPLPPEELQPQLKGVDAVLASMDKFNGQVLSSSEAAGLKLISRWGVGYDAIDVPTATKMGIVVAYTPGMLNETVADCAFALLLSVARRIHLGHQTMSNGQWQSAWGHDVHGKTLGLIGCGRIGQAMARRATGFGMKLLAYDIAPIPEAEKLGVKFVSLDELLSTSDFVSLHAALTPQNRGLLGEAQLRKMKPTAYLINTARGALVEETALVKVLEEKVIAGVALDAFQVEPLPADHPLRKAPNALLTPHLASFARETGERVSMAAAEAIVELMNGRKPRWVVDPEVYKSSALRAKMTGIE